MFYKPNFCNNCGEAVERYSWKLWTSTRFCENCETDRRMIDWFPAGGMFLATLFGLFGFGSYLKSPEKPLNFTNNAVAVINSNKNTADRNSNSTKPANQSFVSNANTANIPTNQTQTKLSLTPPKSAASAEIKQNDMPETVYFCGAQTKKGNPCTRKVKNAGRCWQHEGQPAMLPKEKLVASQ